MLVFTHWRCPEAAASSTSSSSSEVLIHSRRRAETPTIPFWFFLDLVYDDGKSSSSTMKNGRTPGQREWGNYSSHKVIEWMTVSQRELRIVKSVYNLTREKEHFQLFITAGLQSELTAHHNIQHEISLHFSGRTSEVPTRDELIFLYTLRTDFFLLFSAFNSLVKIAIHSHAPPQVIINFTSFSLALWKPSRQI